MAYLVPSGLASLGMSVVKAFARFALLSRLNWGPCVGVFVGVN